MNQKNPFTGSGEMNISSNPATVNTYTYYNDPIAWNSDNFDPINSNLNTRSIYLSGLSISYTRQGNDDYEVSISWNDYEVNNKVRWCGNIIHNEKLYLVESAIITLDQSKTPEQKYRDPVSGEFALPTSFTCNAGSLLSMKDDSRIELTEKSKMLLKAGSIVKVADNASITVESGCTFEIESCATLVIKDAGQLIIKPGGTICMHQGALVYINGTGNFDLQQGYSTGNCLQDILGNCIIQPATNFSPGTTTWTDVQYGSFDHIVIPSGVTLNLINSEIQFAPYARLVVQPNGKLVMNHSRLTNAQNGCNNKLWQGVEVRGNSDLSQTPLTNQGMIQIFNGGSIENAETGIFVDCHAIEENNGNPPSDIVISGFSGGIVRCDSAYFINNRIAVQFGPYYYGNHSHFTRVNFLTDNNMIPGINPLWFVKLEGVHTIPFNGCTFKNSQPDPLEPENYRRGVGLLSYNSDFIVREQCISQQIPCNHIRQSVFEGLFRGIYALDMAGSFNPQITNTFFWGNQKGLYLSGFSDLSNVTVTCNTFKLNVNPMFSNDSVYGMYLDNCSGYHVEQNEFYSILTQRFIGLVVNNSGANANEIYRNTFYNLMYATLSQNYNRNGQAEGLCYKCNQFVKNDGTLPNKYDFMITYDALEYPFTTNTGIAKNQGSLETPAANMFLGDPVPPVPYHYDFWNDGNHVEYFYHYTNPTNFRLEPYPNNIRPVNSVDPNVSWVDFDENTCRSKLGGGELPDGDLILLTEAENKADSLEALLTTLIDGGSTSLLNFEVSSSTPPEALQTRNELMAGSPYLSDTVMKTSITKEDVLNNVMIRDILVANPHSAKSDEIIGMLENRTVPMPDYLMEQILAGADTIGIKEVLETKRTWWNSEGDQSYIRLLNYYKGDSVTPPDEDSLAWLFSYHTTLSSHYDKAAWQSVKGDHEQAMTTLLETPGLFNLSPLQVEVNNANIDFYELLDQLSSDSVSIFSIDSTSASTLLELANTNTGFPSTYARNLLIANEIINYKEPIILPDTSLKSGKKSKFKGVKDDFKSSSLTVYPNPAHDYFIVKFKLNYLPENATIILRDEKGVTVYSKVISGSEDQQFIQVTHLIPGIYILNVESEGKSIESIKIVIVN